MPPTASDLDARLVDALIGAVQRTADAIPEARVTLTLVERWVSLASTRSPRAETAAEAICIAVHKLRDRLVGTPPTLDALEAVAWHLRDVVVPRVFEGDLADEQAVDAFVAIAARVR